MPYWLVMVRIKDLQDFGINPEFLNAIGKAPEEFGEVLLKDKSVQAQYSNESIQAFLTPSYEPLPISWEVEYMLGIPPIPVGIKDDLLPLCHAIRQQKYKYKLLKLIGSINYDFPKTNRTYDKAVEVLLGQAKFNLNHIMNCSFVNAHELEHTTIPYNELCGY